MSTANRIALGALAAAALLASAAYAGARRVEPLPERPAARRAAPMPEVRPRAATGSDAAILAAVARDPFRPERSRPAGRYRMPGEAVASIPTVPVAPVAPPAPVWNLRLLGTVVLPNGGIAAIAGQTGQSRVVRVGEQIDGFRLVRVTPGKARLEGNDTTLTLEMSGGTP